jgi:hypothetical protein
MDSPPTWTETRASQIRVRRSDGVGPTFLPTCQEGVYTVFSMETRIIFKFSLTYSSLPQITQNY